MILLCYIASIFFRAGSHGLHHIGRWKNGNVFGYLETFTWLSLFILAIIARPDYTTGQIIGIATCYFGLRFFLYDVIWNIFAKQKLFYIGNKKLYDRLLRRLNPFMVFWMKICAGVLSVIYLLL